jgi:hypothetical protein
MAMGLVDDDAFQKELDALNRKPVDLPITGQVLDKPIPGRNPGDRNVPESLRKLIGETGATDGRKEAIALAESLGISSSSTSAYTNGATSTATYNQPSEGLKNHIAQAKQRIAKRARHTLNQALDQITPDKLQNTKARDLAGIAKDMSAIVKNMEPENTGNSNPNTPSIVVFAPQLVQENTFEVIHLNE